MSVGNVICLLMGGPLYRIYVDEKWILFEMHNYCGPMPLHLKTQEPRWLGPRHKFWEAVTYWIAQGKQTGLDKKGIKSCVWKRA